MSIYSVELGPKDILEVLIESVASDIEQMLYFHADSELLLDDNNPATQHCVLVEVDELHLIRLADSVDEPIKVTMWNGWKLDGTDHAWTGNSGMVVEELRAKRPALGRSRLWCSDGLGVAEFTNLVATATTGSGADS